jgi:hypothetical protein
MKKHNNKSRFYKDWTTAYLKKVALECDEAIYGSQCYGLSDLRTYSGVLTELSARGIISVQGGIRFRRGGGDK